MTEAIRTALEALTKARAVIQRDRDALCEAHTNCDGAVDVDAQWATASKKEG